MTARIVIGPQIAVLITGYDDTLVTNAGDKITPRFGHCIFSTDTNPVPIPNGRKLPGKVRRIVVPARGK